MSPREYDGADRVVEHYDADGNYTGHTVVKSLWDDHSRGEAEALYELENGFLCPCGCGQPLEDAHDTKTVAVVEKFTCAFRRAVERVERADREKHEKHPEKLDGTFWYPRPYDPERDGNKNQPPQPATANGHPRGRMSSSGRR